MSKIVNISEEKFRRALREIIGMDFGEQVPSEQDTPDDPFNSQRNKIPNPNNRTLDNHDEGLPGKMDYETFDKQLPGAADFPI